MNSDLCQIPACSNYQKYWRNCGHQNEAIIKVYKIPKMSKKKAEENKGKRVTSTIGKVKKTGVDDSRLWKAFSVFIRLRDSDDNGYCQCFTCGLFRHYTGGDCGHGIGRQHWGTRYEERNNHFQCKKCNGFDGGRGDVYKEKVDEKYGAGTWDLLLIKAQTSKKKLSQFEVDALTIHYIQKVEEMCKKKGLEMPKLSYPKGHAKQNKAA